MLIVTSVRQILPVGAWVLRESVTDVSQILNRVCAAAVDGDASIALDGYLTEIAFIDAQKPRDLGRLKPAELLRGRGREARYAMIRKLPR
ncbi:hypothetical protein SS37A_42240 (plasmid) [Methylocystis iwaonis]|uniref:Transposase n=1 Tax=Methylocystis iwaonis TaxID=2885079 RepID=A0ABN6VMC7_9HYPH|nr:hypothetical protein SS37A_42240 [Methylocystis iwaonis]